MSKVIIERIVKHMSGRTTVYHPIIEAIINSIEAIEEKGNNKEGLIRVIFKRNKSQQKLLDMGKDYFLDVEISDNGIGLNEDKLDAFDTLCTDEKIERGGKGFGRFSYIEYFKDVAVESVYEDRKSKKRFRKFDFGRKYEVVENHTNEEVTDKKKETGTTVFLNNLILNPGRRPFEKELKTIAKTVLEKMLVYFISYNEIPKIILLEESGKEAIILNELFNNSEEIVPAESKQFLLEKEENKESFEVKTFKIFFPNSRKSRIVLTAHSREVVSTMLSEYITEFGDEFYEEYTTKKEKKRGEKNYMIKVYVLSKYLNENVNLERSGFDFDTQNQNLLHQYPFSRQEIEEEVVKVIRDDYSDDLNSRREKKERKVEEFLQKHPWYKEYKEKMDMDTVPMDPSDDVLEDVCLKIKYAEERKGRQEINEALSSFDDDIEEKIKGAFSRIEGVKKINLAHYVTMRKIYLDVFKEVLKKDESGKYKKENLVHDIIFPTKKEIGDVPFDKHNLWILDERLNFVEYLKSDKDFVEKSKKRADLILYDKRILFGNGKTGNPIIIFEFKRPGQAGFITSTDKKKDPYEQIVSYVQEMQKNRNIKKPDGRPLPLDGNTPFYGYIVAELSDNLHDWLKGKGFRQLPNGNRWSVSLSELNLYLEYITWDQLLNDAEERNRIFFHHLGL